MQQKTFMKTMMKKTILCLLLPVSIFAQQKLVLPGSEIQVYYYPMQLPKIVATESERIILASLFLGISDSAALQAQGINPVTSVQNALDVAMNVSKPLPKNKLEAVKILGAPDITYHDEWGNGTETLVYGSGLSLDYDDADLNRPDAIRLRASKKALSSSKQPFYITSFKLAVGEKVHQDLLDKYLYQTYDTPSELKCVKNYAFYIYVVQVQDFADYMLSVCVDGAGTITEISFGGAA